MREFLTTQPGVVKSPTTTIFGENQAIGSALGTFPRKHGCAQPNAKAVGFDLNVTFHQNDLEVPALEPAESEGIGHGRPFRQQAHPMAMAPSCKGGCQRMRSGGWLSRFPGTPNPGHEMGFSGHGLKTGLDQTGIDVVRDVVAVVRLMEYAAEVVHRHMELR